MIPAGGTDYPSFSAALQAEASRLSPRRLWRSLVSILYNVTPIKYTYTPRAGFILCTTDPDIHNQWGVPYLSEFSEAERTDASLAFFVGGALHEYRDGFVLRRHPTDAKRRIYLVNVRVEADQPELNGHLVTALALEGAIHAPRSGVAGYWPVSKVVVYYGTPFTYLLRGVLSLNMTAPT